METTEIRREQLQHARRYFLARVAELRKMCDDGTPWVFLCASAFIEYLSTLTESSDHNGPRFKKFIREFMPNAYSEFTYQQSGTNDLPEQMWHVLRCGIVHSFSLLPDSKAHDKVGRNRSRLRCT